jgi:hypothetical protein
MFKESTACLSSAPVVSTELEYALFYHRSAYDLLNRFAIAFLKLYGFEKHQIPDSFRRVTEKAPEARANYGFSTALSNFYTTKHEKFMVLRDVRDAIAHRGEHVGTIFKMPTGFGISGASRVANILKKANLWTMLSPVENDIGSTLAFLALLADDLFTALGDFTHALVESFAVLPPETAPGYRIYARSRFFDHRSQLKEYLTNPWGTVPKKQ